MRFFFNIGVFFEYWRGVFGTFDFFKILGGILNIEGGFLNIGGFLEHWIFSRFFFNFFVLEAAQSPQTASGAPRVAARRPFLVPPRAVHPASDKKAVSGQILSLHRYRCWPTRLCHQNGPGFGRSMDRFGSNVLPSRAAHSARSQY